jgi:hypothetical protein
MGKVAEFRVSVVRIADRDTTKDDADSRVGGIVTLPAVDVVLDVRVQVPAEFTPSSGYGAAKSDDSAPEPLALQQQIRAALEAARPGQ